MESNIKNLVTIILVIILVILAGVLFKSFNGGKNNNESSWQTYTNQKYGYSVKYPKGWLYRELQPDNSGVAFAPNSETSSPKTEKVIIHLNGRGDSCNTIPFEIFIKTAGTDLIENYGTQNSLEKITTSSGLMAYLTTWFYDEENGMQKISEPITYINDPRYNCVGYDHFEVSLRDSAYLDIYKKIINSFVFVDTWSVNQNIPQGWSKSAEFGILYPNNIGGSVNEYYRKNAEMVYQYESGAIPDFSFIFGKGQDTVITWGGDYSNGDSVCSEGDFGTYMPGKSVAYCLNGRHASIAHFSARASVTAEEFKIFDDFIKVNKK